MKTFHITGDLAAKLKERHERKKVVARPQPRRPKEKKK